MVICWGSPAVGPAAYFVTLGTPPTKNEPWSQTSSGSPRLRFSTRFFPADAPDADVAAISADVRARSGPFLAFMVFLLRWCFQAGARTCFLPDRSCRRFFRASALAANARLEAYAGSDAWSFMKVRRHQDCSFS